MAITRSNDNFFGLTEFTEEINQIDRQFSIIDPSRVDMRPTTQTAVLFDLSKTETVLLPAVERGGRATTVGKDNDYQAFSLPLSFFKHEDYLTQEDVLGVRRIGTPDEFQTIDLARAEKLQKMRRQADQTEAYMLTKMAFEGKCVSPDGQTFADMFDLFGISQTEIDLNLGTSSTDLASKLRQIKRTVRDNLTNGGIMRGIEIYMNSDMYERFVSHPSIKEAYRFFTANNNTPIRDDVTDMFVTNGVTIYSVDGSFKLPTGSTADIIEDNTGHVIPLADDMFRGWFGPSDRLSHANNPNAVSELYSWEYDDGKDVNREMYVSMSRLLIPTRPAGLIRLTSSD